MPFFINESSESGSCRICRWKVPNTVISHQAYEIFIFVVWWCFSFSAIVYSFEKSMWDWPDIKEIFLLLSDELWLRSWRWMLHFMTLSTYLQYVPELVKIKLSYQNAKLDSSFIFLSPNSTLQYSSDWSCVFKVLYSIKTKRRLIKSRHIQTGF